MSYGENIYIALRESSHTKTFIFPFSLCENSNRLFWYSSIYLLFFHVYVLMATICRELYSDSMDIRTSLYNTRGTIVRERAKLIALSMSTSLHHKHTMLAWTVNKMRNLSQKRFFKWLKLFRILLSLNDDKFLQWKKIIVKFKWVRRTQSTIGWHCSIARVRLHI